MSEIWRGVFQRFGIVLTAAQIRDLPTLDKEAPAYWERMREAEEQHVREEREKWEKKKDERRLRMGFEKWEKEKEENEKGAALVRENLVARLKAIL